jgi:hypothetical protein
MSFLASIRIRSGLALSKVLFEASECKVTPGFKRIAQRSARASMGHSNRVVSNAFNSAGKRDLPDHVGILAMDAYFPKTYVKQSDLGTATPLERTDT